MTLQCSSSTTTVLFGVLLISTVNVIFIQRVRNNMFGLSIVKTADLNNLKVRVADLETDVDGALDKVAALERKYNNLADQVQRSDKAVRVQLDALAKPKVCPLLAAVPKHVTDPVGAWESKQWVLGQRLAVATKDLQDAEGMMNIWQGRSLNVYLTWCHKRDLLRRSVQQLKQDIYEHSICKPDAVQPPSETAVFVRHKKYGTLGLLKGHHITILSRGNLLDVGDVILNATPAVVHKFWDIELRDSVKLSV